MTTDTTSKRENPKKKKQIQHSDEGKQDLWEMWSCNCCFAPVGAAVRVLCTFVFYIEDEVSIKYC